MVTLLVVLVMAFSAAAPATPAGAASKKQSEIDKQREARREEIKREINSLKEEVKEASQEEADLLGKVDEVRTRRAELDDMVAEIDRRIGGVQRVLDDATERFHHLTGELIQTELRLEAVLAEHRVAKQNLRDRAVAAYINPTEVSAAAMMIRADDIREIAATRGYYRAILAEKREILDRVTALKDQTQSLRGELEAKREEARGQQDVILDQKRQLEAARAEQFTVREQVFAEEQRETALLAQIRERKAEFQSQIAALHAESNGITRMLQGLQSGQTPVPPGSGQLGMPIAGGRVTSYFGPRVHPIFGDSRMHTGIDIGAGAGTPIRAAADGVVVHAGPRGGYGSTTVIDHGGSLATLYAHQSAIYVSEGQRVGRGTVIGAVGCSGYCTGPHLHFEARVNGTPVDPLPYF